MNISETIWALMRAEGIKTDYRLAKLANTEQSTVHRLLTGKSKDPRAKTLEPIAQYFGLTVEQLRAGDIGQRSRGRDRLKEKLDCTWESLSQDQRLALVRVAEALAPPRTQEGQGDLQE